MHLGLSMQLNLHYSCQAKCGGLSPRFVTVIDGIVALFANCSTLNSLPFLITLLITLTLLATLRFRLGNSFFGRLIPKLRSLVRLFKILENRMFFLRAMIIFMVSTCLLCAGFCPIGAIFSISTISKCGRNADSAREIPTLNNEKVLH